MTRVFIHNKYCGEFDFRKFNCDTLFIGKEIPLGHIKEGDFWFNCEYEKLNEFIKNIIL